MHANTSPDSVPLPQLQLQSQDAQASPKRSRAEEGDSDAPIPRPRYDGVCTPSPHTPSSGAGASPQVVSLRGSPHIPLRIPRKTPITTPSSSSHATPTFVAPPAPVRAVFPSDPTNANRDKKWVALLAAAFMVDEGRDKDAVQNTCVRIVGAITGSGSSQEAKDTFLTLLMNLKDTKNDALRNRVMQGDLPVEMLVRMDEHDLVNPERRQQLDSEFQERAKDTNLTEIQKATMTTSTLFPCPNCKARDCSWTQKQTRSGDEPMTIFCTCNRCGRLWKKY